jgi:hypothetical protein
VPRGGTYKRFGVAKTLAQGEFTSPEHDKLEACKKVVRLFWQAGAALVVALVPVLHAQKTALRVALAKFLTFFANLVELTK